MPIDRLLVVIAVLAALVAGRVLYRRWHRAVHTEALETPPLPARLLDGADRTWVVFTTPWCAACNVVTQELAVQDPIGRLVKVDATQDLDLARRYRVRHVPTVLLADGRGEVQDRLVGLEAVRGYVRSPAGPNPHRLSR